MDVIPASERERRLLIKAMNLSLGVGFMMLLLKFGAYWMTGSAAIFADAVETVVHILAVGFASYSLRLSLKPADPSHPYGHAKIGFFSAGVEGALIIAAAVFIIYDAISKWIAGLHLENLTLGVGLTAVTIAINGALGIYLVVLGKRSGSIVLEANGKHVLTDAWTSLGVILALGLILVTGWLPWDPILAILVAINILVSGYSLIRRSIAGLMDEANPEVQMLLEDVLDKEAVQKGIRYHALRHRSLGNGGYWVDLHLLFADHISIKEAHERATEVEKKLNAALPRRSRVTTHLEPKEAHRQIHPDPH
ncbi:MAG: cation transporter [Opitutales bacterium]|nr:cation transporter [Opitutales bacterium]